MCDFCCSLSIKLTFQCNCNHCNSTNCDEINQLLYTFKSLAFLNAQWVTDVQTRGKQRQELFPSCLSVYRPQRTCLGHRCFSSIVIERIGNRQMPYLCRVWLSDRGSTICLYIHGRKCHLYPYDRVRRSDSAVHR